MSDILKRCPCGQHPGALFVDGDAQKYSYVYGGCCSYWHIEFKSKYLPEGSGEIMRLATNAWNEALRDKML